MLLQHAPCHLAAYLLQQYPNKGLVPTCFQQYSTGKLLKQMKQKRKKNGEKKKFVSFLIA